MKKNLPAWIAAVLCTLYGFCIYSTGTGTGFFAIWFLIAFLILLTAYLPACRKKKDSLFLKILQILLRTGWMAAGIVIAVTWALIGTCFSAEGKPGADYLIVLGSQVNKDGPRSITQYRLDAASGYLQENPDTVCIMTGGQGWNEPAPEAAVMKQYLVQKGIPEERILTEEASRNTAENIQNAKKMILAGEGKNSEASVDEQVCIATSCFHVFRGTRLAMHAGFTDITGIAAYTAPFYLPCSMLRESLGILKDFLTGNL